MFGNPLFVQWKREVLCQWETKYHWNNPLNGLNFAIKSKKEDGIMWLDGGANKHGGFSATSGRWSSDPVKQDRYDILREFYGVTAPEYHKRYGDEPEKEVRGFLDEFSGRILVIGCGTGGEVVYLLKRSGCNAFGIDFSPEAILLARTDHTLLRDRFFVGDLYDLDAVLDGEFDGIVANAVLLHLLARDDMRYILKKMSDRLKKGGLCFMALQS